MTSNTPLTVVTICRNADRTIQKTFDSILNQRVRPSEYIIIDACSSDKTIQLAEAMKAKADFPVIIVQEKDLGISDAFNKGIRRASHDWIHLLNADDYYWSEEALADFEVRRLKTSAKVLVGKAGIETPSGGITFEERFGKDTSSVMKSRISHPACIVKKQAYEVGGNYSLSLKTAMDYELLLRFEKIFGADAFEYFHAPFVGVGYGGESIVNAARGYRELAGARLLHTPAHPFRILTGYYLSKFMFTTKLGTSLNRAKRALYSSQKSLAPSLNSK